MGLLTSAYSAELKARLSSPTLTVTELDATVNEFVAIANTVGLGNGYPLTAYGFSKAAGIALTAVQQRQFDEEDNGVIVNAVCFLFENNNDLKVCPGYVATDMTGNKGPLNVDQGAISPLWLAQLPKNSTAPKGEFCYLMNVVKWKKK